MDYGSDASWLVLCLRPIPPPCMIDGSPHGWGSGIDDDSDDDNADDDDAADDEDDDDDDDDDHDDDDDDDES